MRGSCSFLFSLSQAQGRRGEFAREDAHHNSQVKPLTGGFSRLVSLLLATFSLNASWAVGIQTAPINGSRSAKTSPGADSKAASEEYDSEEHSRQAMLVLRKNCSGCHNEEKKKGGLVMTSAEGLGKGGDNGPVVVPGNAKESRLAQVLLREADPHMPPKDQLSESDIALLRAWIDRGAKWNDKALREEIPPLDPAQLRSLPENYRPVLAMALSSDGKRLAFGRGAQVCVYDLSRSKPSLVRRLEGLQDAVQSLAWSADGKWLAAGGYRRIQLWDGLTLTNSTELTNLVGRVTAVDFARDTGALIAADGATAQTGVIHIWTIGEPSPQASWRAHRDTILDLELSADGQRLATASADKLVKLWNVTTGQLVATLEGHTGHVWTLAFNRDGSLLATGSADKEIKIWDLKTREQKISIGRHPASITSLVWTPDGKNLLSVCEDGRVRVCDESKESPQKTFPGIGEMLFTVTAAADGKTVYAGGQDGFVHAWGIDGKSQGRLEE